MSFKIKIKGAPHSHRLPFWCPNCKRQTGTIDDKHLLELGVCSECFILYVDERVKPVIDLSEFAPRGGKFFGMTKEQIDAFFLEQSQKK